MSQRPAIAPAIKAPTGEPPQATILAVVFTPPLQTIRSQALTCTDAIEDGDGRTAGVDDERRDRGAGVAGCRNDEQHHRGDGQRTDRDRPHRPPRRQPGKH